VQLKLYDILNKHALTEARRPSYWLGVLFAATAGLAVTLALSERTFWRGMRYYAYRAAEKASRDAIKEPRQTRTILIGDKSFWGTRLQHRVPIKRDYLADLVSKISKVHPNVIALDVMFAAADPRADAIPDAYAAETEALSKVIIQQVPRTTTIVFPLAILWPENRTVGGIFDYLLHLPNVAVGFTRLNGDVRRVATSVTLDDGRRLDSFALAVVKAMDQSSEADSRWRDDFPFGYMLSRNELAPAVFDADDILQLPDGDPLLQRFAHKAVIIGGDWHPDPSNPGIGVDDHQTPAGMLPGALVHANYIESLLAHVTRRMPTRWEEVGFELFFSLVAATALLLGRGWWKLAFLAVFGGIALLVLYHVAWQNLGVFVDFIPSAVALTLHAGIEQKKQQWHLLSEPAFVGLLLFIAGCIVLLEFIRHENNLLSSAFAHVATMLHTTTDVSPAIEHARAQMPGFANVTHLSAREPGGFSGKRVLASIFTDNNQEKPTLWDVVVADQQRALLPPQAPKGVASPPD